MKKILNWLKSEESGQGMVEYGLIIALISIIAITAITAIGGGINNIFTKAKDEVIAAE